MQCVFREGKILVSVLLNSRLSSKSARLAVLGVVEVPVKLILVERYLPRSQPLSAAEGTRTKDICPRFCVDRVAPVVNLICQQFNTTEAWPADTVHIISRASRAFSAKPSLIDRFWSKTIIRKLDRLLTDYRTGELPWGEVEQSFGRVQIGVSADGIPFLVNGLLSYAIALGIGIDTIPAEVVRRDAIWEEFRQELFSFAKLSMDEDERVVRDLSHFGGRLYQQAYHFDTRDVPHVYGTGRLDCILENVHSTSRTVLDIGANFGLMSSQFERAGFSCTAVEVKEDDYYFLEKLRDYTGGTFASSKCSIFDFRSSEILAYDIVLALFIFHHFTKTRALFEKLIELLKRIRCREIYLGLPDPNEPQMEGVYKNLSTHEFASLVMENTGLEKFSKVECSGLGNRTILKIWRD